MAANPAPQARKVAADASLKVYYEPKDGPLMVGKMRSMTYRNPLVTGDEEKPGGVWHKRFNDYWQRQGKMYGFEPSNISIAARVDEVAGPCVTSFCVIKAILPGRRVKRHLLSEHDRIQ